MRRASSRGPWNLFGMALLSAAISAGCAQKTSDEGDRALAAAQRAETAASRVEAAAQRAEAAANRAEDAARRAEAVAEKAAGDFGRTIRK